MTHASLVVAAVAVLAGAGCRSGADGAAKDPAASAGTVVETNAVIERVVDGDTVDVVVDGRRERVRLIGIDTPETKDEDGPVECYGPQATAATSALLPEGTPIRLERDVEPRDDYGRLLAYVLRGRDGLFVNVELARQGAATTLSIRPNTTHAGAIRAAEAAARRARLGLWGVCPAP